MARVGEYDNGNGNGYLKYPVGLITADEIMMAGGLSYYDYGDVEKLENKYFYLYKGQSYWTMSPAYRSGYYSGLKALLSEGFMDTSDSYGKHGIAPVINLNIETSRNLVGSGTMNDPYRLN